MLWGNCRFTCSHRKQYGETTYPVPPGGCHLAKPQPRPRPPRPPRCGGQNSEEDAAVLPELAEHEPTVHCTAVSCFSLRGTRGAGGGSVTPGAPLGLCPRPGPEGCGQVGAGRRDTSQLIANTTHEARVLPGGGCSRQKLPELPRADETDSRVYRKSPR